LLCAEALLSEGEGAGAGVGGGAVVAGGVTVCGSVTAAGAAGVEAFICSGGFTVISGSGPGSRDGDISWTTPPRVSTIWVCFAGLNALPKGYIERRTSAAPPMIASGLPTANKNPPPTHTPTAPKNHRPLFRSVGVVLDLGGGMSIESVVESATKTFLFSPFA
jgi:hypothetical protein